MRTLGHLSWQCYMMVATAPVPPVLEHHKIYGRVSLVTDHQLKVRCLQRVPRHPH